jgi:hypothetical protein
MLAWPGVYWAIWEPEKATRVFPVAEVRGDAAEGVRGTFSACATFCATFVFQTFSVVATGKKRTLTNKIRVKLTLDATPRNPPKRPFFES